jgi:tyrosyl-tRNA synthetase
VSDAGKRATPEVQLEELCRGAVDVQRGDELLAKLRSGRPLRVKAGFDPTKPDLHLGHTVLMQKMRQFQDFGHDVVFVVGNFTASIGDPSGKSATRPPLSDEEIAEGARSYAEQAFKVLDEARTEVVYNRDWLGPMGFADVIRLASRYTLARMLERDDFKRRYAAEQSIRIHELLYPLVQAYDSVHLKADVELGGTDQLFNLLVGRELMRDYGLPPQVILTTPILEGINARVEGGAIVGDKMSKSLDNYVGITEPPREMFGKLMSINDALMFRYYELLSARSKAEIDADRAAAGRGEVNPKVLKVRLAEEIVGRFWSPGDAIAAAEAWEAQFSRREVPDDMPEITLALEGQAETLVARVLAEAQLVPSVSEGRRRIKGGAVKIDDAKVADIQATLGPGTYVVRAGKRAWARVTLEP